MRLGLGSHHLSILLSTKFTTIKYSNHDGALGTKKLRIIKLGFLVFEYFVWEDEDSLNFFEYAEETINKEKQLNE